MPSLVVQNDHLVGWEGQIFGETSASVNHGSEIGNQETALRL